MLARSASWIHPEGSKSSSRHRGIKPSRSEDTERTHLLGPFSMGTREISSMFVDGSQKVMLEYISWHLMASHGRRVVFQRWNVILARNECTIESECLRIRFIHWRMICDDIQEGRDVVGRRFQRTSSPNAAGAGGSQLPARVEAMTTKVGRMDEAAIHIHFSPI